MSQRHKHRPAAPRVDVPEGLAAQRAHVADLLARGKTRDAVEVAKQLYKQARSVETEALLVDAYAARIRALIATGMAREARELASLVVERYPGTQGRIMPMVRESTARVEGDLGPLLALRASGDASTRREAEITLRREGYPEQFLLIPAPSRIIRRCRRTIHCESRRVWSASCSRR